MSALRPADLVIVGVYLAATLLFGLWMRKRATQSLEHYYLGGRRMPWPLLGISGMANWFDLTGTMIITSFLFMLGPRGLFIEFRGGAVLVLAFMLLWTGKWYRRSKCMTGPEWYVFRFGAGRAAEALRVISAVFGIVFTIGMLAYLVRGTSLFLGVFLPLSPMAATVIVIAFSTLYTMIAGFYGVIVNDLVQGIIIVVTCLIVAALAFNLVPDAATLAVLAERVTGNAEWMSAMPAVHTTMPAGYEAYESLLLFAGFYLVKSIFDGAGSGDDARYFAARSDRDCGLLSLMQGVTVAFRWPMMMGFAVFGLFLVNNVLPDRDRTAAAAAAIKAHVPEITEGGWHNYTSLVASYPQEHPELTEELSATLGARWQEALPLIGYHGTVNPEQVLPAVMRNSLPSGLRGFVLVAMLAAMMSTLAGQVNSVGSAMFVRDIYQNVFRPRANNRELIIASYAATAAIVGIGFYMGVSARSINHLWGWIMMGFGAGALAPKFLRLYWWRCTAWGCAAGLALGGVSAIVQRLLWPEMVEWKQFLLTGGIGVAGVIVGSWCSAPPDRDIVRRFYRQTRPFGLWKPFWNELTPTEQVGVRKEHRNDLAALPFTMVAQIALFMLSMQIVLHAYGAFFATLPFFVVGALGMYWFWWRHLPGASAADDATALSDDVAVTAKAAGRRS